MDSEQEGYSQEKFVQSVNAVVKYRPVTKQDLSARSRISEGKLLRILKGEYISTTHRARILGALGFSTYAELDNAADDYVAEAAAKKDKSAVPMEKPDVAFTPERPIDDEAGGYSRDKFVSSVQMLITHKYITKTQLAKKCHISTTDINKILNGYVSTDYRARILGALGFSTYAELYSAADACVVTAANKPPSEEPVQIVSGGQVEGLVFHSAQEERQPFPGK